jgi:hypothetical protein
MATFFADQVVFCVARWSFMVVLQSVLFVSERLVRLF